MTTINQELCMPNIFIPQKSMTITVASGDNLMQALQAAELPVASSCLGDGICSMCKVNIEGKVPGAAQLEQQTLLRNKLSADQRLSCQISVTSDITVTTSYW
ncbi:MAG: 2Fe-2S iron-sulfur cluster binding domain-containing protein [Pseudobdellovibrio sp.]